MGLERLRTFPDRDVTPRSASGRTRGHASGHTFGLGLENVTARTNPAIFLFDEEMIAEDEEDEDSGPVAPRGCY
jgi:hypothetical protein